MLYQIALTTVPQIGPVQARLLVDTLGSATAVFKAKKSSLEKIEGIGSVRAASIKNWNDFKLAEAEVRFIDAYKIIPLFIKDTAYPKRLLHCYDAPTLLYYRGNADLNTTRVVSIVGTRNKTEYGRSVTEKFIADISSYPVLIVSGLAMGIDTIAHKAALKHNLPTVGVLAHGMDKIYPPENKRLAKDMLAGSGGLLTEFPSKTIPDRHHFPTRNRIVAGMADATVVAETAVKGGSIITAELAFNYNKDLFAFPGRTIDTKSAGCNYLIKQNKAILITEATDLLNAMNWNEQPIKKNKIQRELFIHLSEEEEIITSLLKEKEDISIDELSFKSGLSASSLAAAILNLEMENIITALPGKRYKLV